MAFLKLSLSVFEVENFINEPVVYCDFNPVPFCFLTESRLIKSAFPVDKALSKTY